MILRFVLTLCVSTLAFAALAQPADSGRTLDGNVYFFGKKAPDEWSEAPAAPHEGERLEVRFDAKANPTEHVIAITHRDVARKWALQLNETEIAALERVRGITPATAKREVHYYRVPPDALKDGENVLSIVRDAKENTTIGPIVYHEKAFRELIGLQPVTITVTDEATGKPVPARVTITDSKGELAEIFEAESLHTAIRRGIIYMPGRETRLELPEGNYTVYATRGMEWSLARHELTVSKSSSASVALRIRREVDTTGFIAADTHIHTLTFSGHGDSSVEERIITLAGEGVELAISTDHNHQTDYRPYQEKAGFNEYFTSVVGNEVSTPVGHFNSFPLDPEGPVPPHKENEWITVVTGARAAGAKVVIMNHPRWPTIERSQFTRHGLNRASGDFAADVEITFDAMELANALTPQPDPLYVFRDWFALLNHGEKISAVGSSDSHTVGAQVGQGRTYIPSATDDPAQIDVDDACERILAGQHSIALGIFTDIRLNKNHKMGDLVSVKGKDLNIELRVAAPGWVTPRRAIVYINGTQVDEQSIPKAANRPVNTWLEFSVPAPQYDAHLVCVILGDKVTEPAWRTKADYTLAATNPIYLDADGDGKYQSPRETAAMLLAKAGEDFESRWKAMLQAGEPIAVQMLSLMYQREDWRGDIAIRIRGIAARRPLALEFLRYSPAPEPVAAN